MTQPHAIDTPDRLLTVAVYLKADTRQRVLVDQLGGTHDEAITTALAILGTVAAAGTEQTIARVVAHQQITTV